MDRETATPHVETFPGESAERWIEYHHRFAAPATYVYDFVWDVTRNAAGPFCTDVDGNVLLDFTSHVASAPLGYNDPAFLDRLAAFDLVDPLKIAGQDFYASRGDAPGESDLPGPAELTDRLTDLAAHYDLDTVFLSNSGAEANENAFKICYDHTGGSRAATFDGAFHGRTLGALSFNRSKAIHRRGFPELSKVFDLPYCDDRGCDADTCSCGFFAGGTSRLRRKTDPEVGDVDPEEVAFVVFEPVQGEGGLRIPSESFVAEVADVCDEYGIPIVADEVQSGLGRTGEMWGSDHFDVAPDVITSAKALRVGATISTSDVFPKEPGRLSSTWGGGDLLHSLAGALTIDAIRERDLTANAETRGTELVERLRDGVPDFVEDVRGLGLMVGVELDSKARRGAAIEACLRRGLLLLGAGNRTLRLLPPLTVTEREIELGAELLCDALHDSAVRNPSPAGDVETGQVGDETGD